MDDAAHDDAHGHDDAALLAGIRAAAMALDPPPADLADRMIAAVAVADLSREYALLTLTEAAAGAVRSESATATLQFGDGEAHVLLHISRTAGGRRRIDGWTTAEAEAVHLLQDAERIEAPAAEGGRFAFDDVAPGLYRVLIVTAADDDEDLLTPQFEA